MDLSSQCRSIKATMKLKDTAKTTLLNWINAKDIGLKKVGAIRELRSGDHFYAIAVKSGLIKHDSTLRYSKFDSVISFLDGYYGNNVMKSINIVKARSGDDLELAKICMLLLNAVLTTDDSYIPICDKLPSPAPRQILEIVQTLITADTRSMHSLKTTTTIISPHYSMNHENGNGDGRDNIDIDYSSIDECFKVLYENDESTIEPSLQELSKRLRFDDTCNSIDVTFQAGDGDHSRAGGDQSHLQEPAKSCSPSRTSPSCASLLDDTSNGTPVANFVTSNRKPNRSANVETPTTSRSPLSKLSQSPLVQFKRQIREKDLEIKRLKEFLAEKNYEIDSLKAESCEFGRRIRDLTVEIHNSKRSDQEFKKLKRDNEQAVIEQEKLTILLREKDNQIEKLKADQKSINDYDLEIKSLRQLNRDLEKSNDILISKVEAKEKNINDLNGQIQSLKVQIDRKDEDSRRECDYQREQILHLQSELKLYRDRLDEMNFSVENDKKYEHISEQLKMDLARKDAVINDISCTLTKEREHFATSVSSLTNEIKSLNAKSDDLLNKVKSLECNVSEKSDVADRTYKDLQICRSENLELKQNAEKATIQLIENRHQFDILKENNDRLGAEILKKDVELASRVKELDSQKNALHNRELEISDLRMKYERLNEEKLNLNAQIDELKVQLEGKRSKTSSIDKKDDNELKILNDKLKEMSEESIRLKIENESLNGRILDRERQMDDLKMKYAEEIISLQRRTLEKQSPHRSCNVLSKPHALDASAIDHSKGNLSAFVTPRIQSKYGSSFQMTVNSKTRPEDLYSLRSADSGETFRSVRSADHFFDHNLGCENEPDIMVEHSLTPVNVKSPSRDHQPLINIVEKQVAISMHSDPLASAFKRPLTPTLRISFEHNVSTENVQDFAKTPETSDLSSFGFDLFGSVFVHTNNSISIFSGLHTPTENWSRRLTILNDRNKMVPPHLKSFYPAETQILPVEIKENDVKFSNDYKAPEITVEKTKRKVDETSKFPSSPSTSTMSPGSSSTTSKTLKHSAKKSSKLTSVGKKIKRLWREPTAMQNMSLTPDPTMKDYQRKKSSIAFSIDNSGHKPRKPKKNSTLK